MKILDVKQGTQEWLDCRLGKLTASDAQAIATAGKGLETLCIEKVAQRLTGKAEEGYKNHDMERGHELEMEARNSYELETGNTVQEVGFCELDEDVGASPDGMVGEEGLVEIKCKSDTVFVRELLADSIDSAHVWQMQFQLWVTDRKWCDYAVYNPNFPKSLIIKRVNRDEDAIEKIKSGVEAGKTMIKNCMEKINGRQTN